ncbi:MAG: ATP-binding cassette domain-containing protein [Clostridiales bacterium]|nr:ATP-binding cassette domain-containing protein [Clostridiales bacterium]
MIELKNISFKIFDEKEQKDKYILKNMSVKFPENKITVITGQNGSGKSTLIKLIMGILSPTTGDIFFNGQNITKTTVSERANLGLTLAFQQPVRFKGLTVGQLLNLANKSKNNLSDSCEYLSRVGLCAKEYINREFDDTLSGGEAKRIELAMALAKQGKVFLFDEPEAGIDLWSFDGLVEIFKSLKNKTVIVVSHQKKLIESADYVFVLNDEGSVFGKRKDMEKFLNNPVCLKMGGRT